jgi:hypothetical protein
MAMRVVGLLALLLVVVAVFSGRHGDTPASASSGAASSPASEIVLTAAMKRDVGAAVRGAGYNCPEPKLAFRERPDAYGDVVQLYCGPSGRDGVYADFTFRITFRPNGAILIAPWN